MQLKGSMWLASLFLATSACYGQSIWTNTGGGLWSTGTNWQGGSAPPSGATVYVDYAPHTITGGIGSFSTELNYTLSLTSIFSRAHFTLTGATLSLSNTASDFRGQFNFNSGTVSGGGMTVWGGMNFRTTSTKVVNAMTLNINGPGLTEGGRQIFTNSTVNYNGPISLTDGEWNDGVHNILSAGSFNKSVGASDFNVGSPWNGGPISINNAGTITSSSGNIRLLAGGQHTGTFAGNVLFASGTHSLKAGSAFQNGVRLVGSTLSIPLATDTLQLTGTTTATSGALIGAGKLIGTGTLLIPAGSLSLGGSLTNQATMRMTSSGVVLATNATLNNLGTFLAENDMFFRDGIFNNLGTVTKTGAATSTFGQTWNGGPTQFNNSGTMTAADGIAQIVNGGTHSGTFSTSAGGTIQFNAGTHNFLAGNSMGSGVQFNNGGFTAPSDGGITCAGDLQFRGGTLYSTGPGAINFSGPGSLNLLTSAGTLSGILRFNGTTNMPEGTKLCTNATLTNTGSFNISNASTSSQVFLRDGVFNNQGTLNKSGPGTFVMSQTWNGGPVQFNNTGTVNVTAGDLNIPATGNHTGIFNVTGGGTLTFPAGYGHTLRTGSVFNGNVQFAGATISIPAGESTRMNGTTISAGTMTGGGVLSGPGSINFVGSATIGGALTTTVPISVNNAARYLTNATFTNNNTITFSGTTENLWRDGITVNNGTMRVLSGGLKFETWFGGPTTLQNSGLIEADNSPVTVLINGNHNGTIRGVNNGTVRLQAGTQTFFGGSVLGDRTTSVTAMVTNQSVEIQGTYTFESGTWSGSGSIVGENWRWNGPSRTIAGSLTNDANILHESGPTYFTNATFTNGGTATLSDGVIWRDGVQVNNGLLQKVSGAGTAVVGETWFGGPNSFRNDGRLNCTDGVLRIVQNLLNYDAGQTRINGGTYEAGGTGNLSIPVGNITKNAGRFVLNGPTAKITRSDQVTSVLPNISENIGGLELRSTANLTLNGALLNTGDIFIGSGSTLNFPGAFTQNDGETKVNGSLPKLLTVNGGAISGTGQFLGATLVNADILPGDALGVLSSTGNVSMTNTDLEVQVKNSTAGNFDRLAVTGTATISGGSLRADAAPNSTVAAGTVVDVLTSTGVRSGTFTNVPPPADWTVTYGGNFVRLTAARAIRGPILIEGEVDLDRYLGSYTNVGLTFTLKQGGSTIETQTVFPNPDRTYAYSTRLRGSYELWISGAHWLDRYYPIPVNLTDAGLTGVDLGLVNGDVNHDNEVGPADFTLMSAAFGSSTGDPNWNAAADVDGNEEVGPGDFTIIASNFGQMGD